MGKIQNKNRLKRLIAASNSGDDVTTTTSSYNVLSKEAIGFTSGRKKAMGWDPRAAIRHIAGRDSISPGCKRYLVRATIRPIARKNRFSSRRQTYLTSNEGTVVTSNNSLSKGIVIDWNAINLKQNRKWNSVKHIAKISSEATSKAAEQTLANLGTVLYVEDGKLVEIKNGKRKRVIKDVKSSPVTQTRITLKMK
ncbi:hypothetical protein [Viscerimonas tarda]